MQKKVYEMVLGDKMLTAEFSDLAEQASGSVLLRLGETAVLVTATMNRHEGNSSYFPLSVEFEERFYAAGQILGSRFMRREGKPSDESLELLKKLLLEMRTDIWRTEFNVNKNDLLDLLLGRVE